jgi:hypothetical protein
MVKIPQGNGKLEAVNRRIDNAMVKIPKGNVYPSIYSL